MPRRRFIARSPVAVPASELYAWHLRPGAFARLNPGWQPAEVVESEPLAEGSRARLRIGTGPLKWRWVAEHSEFQEGRQFLDTQVQGPFRSWVHTHGTLDDGRGGAILEDRIELELPLGALGDRLGRSRIEASLERMFRWRHAATAGDLSRHARFAGAPRLTVAVSGAGGFVGSKLVAFLESGGHRVRRLVRRDATGESEIAWDPLARTIDTAALEGVDAVVHLAGESIASGLWTPARKARIRQSRVAGTSLIAETLARLERRPAVLVNATAIGYYGDRGEERLDETSAPGAGFLAEVSRQWEDATSPSVAAGIRVVRLRIGVVLGARGGLLGRLAPIFALGLGGRLGSGEQFVSWIGVDDLVGVIHHALLDSSLDGPVNAVAPHPVRNVELTRILGRVLRRPAPWAVPAFALRRLPGGMGREMMLASARVIPSRLHASGFEFLRGDLESALRFELGHLRNSPPGISITFD